MVVNKVIVLGGGSAGFMAAAGVGLRQLQCAAQRAGKARRNGLRARLRQHEIGRAMACAPLARLAKRSADP